MKKRGGIRAGNKRICYWKVFSSVTLVGLGTQRKLKEWSAKPKPMTFPWTYLDERRVQNPISQLCVPAKHTLALRHHQLHYVFVSVSGFWCQFSGSTGLERELHGSAIQFYTTKFYRYPGSLLWCMHYQNINILLQSWSFSAVETWNQDLENISKVVIYMCLNNISKVMQPHLKFAPLGGCFPNKWSGSQPHWSQPLQRCQRADWQPKGTALVFWKSQNHSLHKCALLVSFLEDGNCPV